MSLPRSAGFIFLSLTQIWSSWLTGSREQTKWVKMYDDYRIENSKRWRLIRYHFVKIDTWLEGTLSSFCSEHAWHPKEPKGNRLKNSIFSGSDQSDAQGAQIECD